MGEALKLGDKLGGVCLEPTAEGVVLVPGNRDREPESLNVSPAARDFVREAEGLNIQVDFAIE